MNIQAFLRKILLKHKATSESYISYLRKKGMRIGERTTIYSPNHCIIDETRPWMIEIGNDVQITHGCIILTHGYDWAVLKGVYGNVMGSCGKVHIGNNVFIGMNSVILKGVTVGNNVIIGAGSVINSDIPNNCVVAGNPAKVIMSLEDYYTKRLNAQEHEAMELVKEHRAVYGRNPSAYAMSEFFWLYTNDLNGLHWSWINQMEHIGNFEYSSKKLLENKCKYKDMQDFFEHC